MTAAERRDAARAEYVNRVVGSWPPLTPEAIEELGELMDSSGGYVQDHPDVRSACGDGVETAWRSCEDRVTGGGAAQ